MCYYFLNFLVINGGKEYNETILEKRKKNIEFRFQIMKLEFFLDL